jgi:hypothetical protein
LGDIHREIEMKILVITDSVSEMGVAMRDLRGHEVVTANCVNAALLYLGVSARSQEEPLLPQEGESCRLGRPLWNLVLAEMLMVYSEDNLARFAFGAWAGMRCALLKIPCLVLARHRNPSMKEEVMEGVNFLLSGLGNFEGSYMSGPKLVKIREEAYPCPPTNWLEAAQAAFPKLSW